MNISELASPGINLDTDLNKDLFLNDESLNPRAMSDLADLIERFSDELGLKDDAVEDVVMTGSNAGFAHTPDSTIVINVVVPPTDDSIYRELLDAKMALFMAQNNPQVMGYPADVSIVDTECPCGNGGMYSVRENQWRSVPKRRAADSSDLAVLALGESWLRAVEMVQERPELTESFEARWRRFESAAIEGSCERMVMAEMGSLVKRALTESRMILESQQPKPVRMRESFRNGFAEEDEMAAGGGGVGGTSGGTKMILEKEPMKKSDIIRQFFDFCIDYLEIDSPPEMRLKKDPAWSERNSTFGRYLPQEHTMELSLANRHINDICRTLAHELVHVRQHEIEDVPSDAGETGSKWENEANAMAGVIMRDWGREHPEFFSADTVAEASGYIPTRKQAHDPRWEMALTRDVRPGETGRQANKLDLQTDAQGHPALLHKKLRNVIKEGAETEVPDWLISLYDKMVRADYAGGRGAAPKDKRAATLASKAVVKGIQRHWGDDGARAHGYDLAMAHKALHGYDDLDDYLSGEQLQEGATDDSYLWQARVKINQKETGYTGYIPVTVAAPDMRRARILIAGMYNVKDKDIGSTTKVKRK